MLSCKCLILAKGALHSRSETVAAHSSGDQVVAVEGHARQHDVSGGPTPRLVQPHRDVILWEGQEMCAHAEAVRAKARIGWGWPVSSEELPERKLLSREQFEIVAFACLSLNDVSVCFPGSKVAPCTLWIVVA